MHLITEPEKNSDQQYIGKNKKEVFLTEKNFPGEEKIIEVKNKSKSQQRKPCTMEYLKRINLLSGKLQVWEKKYPHPDHEMEQNGYPLFSLNIGCHSTKMLLLRFTTQKNRRTGAIYGSTTMFYR